MKYIVILFICFISSLIIVNYEDTSDVVSGYDESVYAFRDYTENDENVSNPETDDLELKSNIIIIFYSFLFSLFFRLNMNKCNRYYLQ